MKLLATGNMENVARYMELDTESYSLYRTIKHVISSWNTLQTTRYMQHLTKYSLHGTQYMKLPTTQNKKQGTHYTACIWQGLLALALDLPSCRCPDVLRPATTPETIGDLHSPDPQTHHLLAE
jgi:hypothetical protein